MDALVLAGAVRYILLSDPVFRNIDTHEAVVIQELSSDDSIFENFINTEISQIGISVLIVTEADKVSSFGLVGFKPRPWVQQ